MAHRKGQRPTLPLSAFSPPNTGTSDRFPLSVDPSSLHPVRVVDSHVLVPAEQWKIEAGSDLLSRTDSIVLSIKDHQFIPTSSPAEILSFIVPLDLSNGIPNPLPSFLESAQSISVAISTIFKNANPKQTTAIQWALSKGLVVHVDVRCDLINGEQGWEALEELVTSCSTAENKGALVIGMFACSLISQWLTRESANIMPPPHTLQIPLVKLLSHPIYLAYQSRIAAISLSSTTFVQLLPPDWNDPTPSTPAPEGAALQTPLTPSEGQTPAADSKEKREWKRRIKMYIGPVIEAFGFERILFGSSPVASATAPSKVADWYELSRECFAELGIEQAGIDAIFGQNAKVVFGNKTV